MSWAAVAIGGAGLLAGGGAGFGTAQMNKKKKGQMIGYEPYTGYEPPAVDTKEYESFRPVQQQYTEILKRRSLGEDVGYDPRVRQMYLENYDLENIPIQRQQMGDLTNQLGGAGLSRNLAAREAILGRQQDEYNRQRNLYRNKVDISDLERRNQERDVNTSRLGALNAQNFQQENTRANFDLNKYGTEQGLRLGVAGHNANIVNSMESAVGTGISSGLTAAGGMQTMFSGMPQQKRLNSDWGNFDKNMFSLGGGYRNTGPIPIARRAI